MVRGFSLLSTDCAAPLSDSPVSLSKDQKTGVKSIRRDPNSLTILRRPSMRIPNPRNIEPIQTKQSKSTKARGRPLTGRSSSSSSPQTSPPRSPAAHARALASPPTRPPPTPCTASWPPVGARAAAGPSARPSCSRGARCRAGGARGEARTAARCWPRSTRPGRGGRTR